jgi:tRNA A-37 threonylcarbamoyl transferase component Bud32
MDRHIAQIPVVCRQSTRRLALYGSHLPDDLVETLWNEPASLVSASEPLQRRGVRATVKVTWAGQHYVLKHYVEPSWRHALKRTVLPSRANLTWNVAHKLAAAGVATPRPVAYVENRWGRLRRDSFLMYPYVEGRTLSDCFGCGLPESQPMKDSLWRQLGELWQKLVELQASLADTNTGNFIVCPAGRLWVIDLDKARFHRLAWFATRRQRDGWQRLLRSSGKVSARVGGERFSAQRPSRESNRPTPVADSRRATHHAKPRAAGGPASSGTARRAAS